MQVAKWGNNLAVRLPSAVVQALELKEGDEIEIHVADARQLGVVRKPRREELLRRLRVFRGHLPADFLFDRDDANGRQAASPQLAQGSAREARRTKARIVRDEPCAASVMQQLCTQRTCLILPASHSAKVPHWSR